MMSPKFQIRKTPFVLNTTPGPYDFQVEFYKNFWNINKTDLIDLFSYLHVGQLDFSA